MSRLDELIKELCPNGVEYISIGSVVNYEQPSKYIVKSTDYNDAFSIPVLTAGQSFILGYTNEKNNLYNASKENPVIIFDDFTGAFKWVDFPFKIKSSAIKILTVNADKTVLRYIYHIMGNIGYFSDEHKRLWISIYSAIRIPLPPLPVQQEIVRILDNFTELTTELTEKLTAEQKARRKQYEYYRDRLLTFDNGVANKTGCRRIDDLINELCPNGVEYKTLGEIAVDIYRGSGITREQVTKTGTPCVRYGEIYTTYGIWFDECVSYTDASIITNKKYFEHGDILFAITGESIDEIAKSSAYIGHEKCLAGGDLVVLKHTQNPKYISYALATTDAQKQKSKGKIKSKVVHSSVPAIKEILIPLPPLPVQEEIVRILDKFDALCNDLSSGLPAEIEARQKQYEYYRDKLLSFKEVSA